MNMKKKTAIFMICMLCMQVIFVGCASKGDTEEEKLLLKPAVVEEIKEESYFNEVSLSGNIKPAKTVKLAYKVNGVVENIYVEEGSVVKKNDVIMALDTYDYSLDLEGKQAKWESSNLKMKSQIPSKINQAKAKLDLISTNYERIKNLYEQGVLPKSKMDEIETKYIAAKNTYQEALDAKEYTEIEIKQAKAARDYAQLKLDDTKLVSPINGIVLKKIAEAGETIGKGYPVIVLGELGDVEVEIGVSDAVINRVKKGQKAKVYVYGIEKEFEGVVSEVGALADSKTRAFPVKVKVKNEDNELKPGMVGKVNIPLEGRTGIFVPVDSVMNMPEGQIIFVYSEEEGIVKGRKVVQGEIVKDKVEIVSGLNIGDKIVVEGQLKLKDNDKVNVEANK